MSTTSDKNHCAPLEEKSKNSKNKTPLPKIEHYSKWKKITVHLGQVNNSNKTKWPTINIDTLDANFGMYE